MIDESLQKPRQLPDGSRVVIEVVTLGKKHRLPNTHDLDDLYTSRSSQAILFRTWRYKMPVWPPLAADRTAEVEASDSQGRRYKVVGRSLRALTGPPPTETRDVWELPKPPEPGIAIMLHVFLQPEPPHLATSARFAEFTLPNSPEWRQQLVKTAANYDRSGERSKDELARAITQDDMRTVKALIHKGVRLTTRGKLPFTDLIFALYKNDTALAKELLRRGGAVNTRGADGRTPLMWAAEGGHAEIVKILLAKGADVNAKDSYGNTALKMAAVRRHGDVVNLLKAMGAKN